MYSPCLEMQRLNGIFNSILITVEEAVSILKF